MLPLQPPSRTRWYALRRSRIHISAHNVRMRHTSCTVAYFTRHLSAYTLIGRASVISLLSGAVFLGTEPSAKMQCGSR